MLACRLRNFLLLYVVTEHNYVVSCRCQDLSKELCLLLFCGIVVVIVSKHITFLCWRKRSRGCWLAVLLLLLNTYKLCLLTLAKSELRSCVRVEVANTDFKINRTKYPTPFSSNKQTLHWESKLPYSIQSVDYIRLLFMSGTHVFLWIEERSTWPDNTNTSTNWKHISRHFIFRRLLSRFGLTVRR